MVSSIALVIPVRVPAEVLTPLYLIISFPIVTYPGLEVSTGRFSNAVKMPTLLTGSASVLVEL